MKEKLLCMGTPARAPAFGLERVRRSCAGLVMAAVLAVLGACGGSSLPPESETLSGKIENEGGLVTVKVKVSPPQAQNSGARSVDPGSVQFYANYYEAVFKNDNGTEDNTDDDTYYRGVGTPTQGYVNIAVPPGDGYKVLLLAGINRVLVAAGFESDVEIVAGTDNLVTMKLATCAPQWDTSFDNDIGENPYEETWNDFIFEAALTYDNNGADDVVIDKKNRLVHVAPFVAGEEEDPDKGPGDIDPANDTFAVKYNFKRLEALIDAEKFNEGDPDTLRLFYYDVYVHHRYIGDKFTTVELRTVDTNFDFGYNGENKLPDDGAVLFVNHPDDGGNKHSLPNKNTDGLLVFNLYYYAFGTDKSGGSLWTIKNGLYSAAESPDGVAELDDAESPTGKGATLG
ncbi:MAG: hypothetical protein LBD58_10855, partial [Treponema sp.]|nr:hypothetical protein [Treponema sp.]